jgi:hypothetical protein|tara:strand:- start:1437 stop:2642 length:1206 start_codon:yes stop_codon:yes gene_type:complete
MYSFRVFFVLSILLALSACGGVGDGDNDDTLTGCLTDEWSHEFRVYNGDDSGGSVDTLDVTLTFRDDGTARQTVYKDVINWDDIFRADDYGGIWADLTNGVVGEALGELLIESFVNLTADGYYVTEGTWSANEDDQTLMTAFPTREGYSVWSEYYAVRNFNDRNEELGDSYVVTRTFPAYCKDGTFVYDVMRKELDNGEVAGNWANSTGTFSVHEDVEERGAIATAINYQSRHFSLEHSSAGYQASGCLVQNKIGSDFYYAEDYVRNLMHIDSSESGVELQDIDTAGEQATIAVERHGKLYFVIPDNRLVSKDINGTTIETQHAPSVDSQSIYHQLGQFDGGIYYLYYDTGFVSRVFSLYDDSTSALSGELPGDSLIQRIVPMGDKQLLYRADSLYSFDVG